MGYESAVFLAAFSYPAHGQPLIFSAHISTCRSGALETLWDWLPRVWLLLFISVGYI
jgi:hypothetical protein